MVPKRFLSNGSKKSFKKFHNDSTNRFLNDGTEKGP